MRVVAAHLPLLHHVVKRLADVLGALLQRRFLRVHPGHVTTRLSVPAGVVTRSRDVPPGGIVFELDDPVPGTFVTLARQFQDDALDLLDKILVVIVL